MLHHRQSIPSYNHLSPTESCASIYHGVFFRPISSKEDADIHHEHSKRTITFLLHVPMPGSLTTVPGPIFLVRPIPRLTDTDRTFTNQCSSSQAWLGLCNRRYGHSNPYPASDTLTDASVFAAGAGAYYFAKKEINKDRQAKIEQHRLKKQHNQTMEYGDPARDDNVGSPSQEASSDPAPTRHAPATEAERVGEKGKYEASTPFVSRKGDRFS